MRFDADQLREQYAALSDDALLAVNPAELVPLARECYEAEVAQRGLAAAPPASAEPEGPTDHLEGETAAPTSQVVPVADFGDASEAAVAKSMLKFAGIPCALSTEYSGMVNLGPYGSTGAIYLLVHEEHLQDAQEVLASEISEEELAAQAEAAAMEEDVEEEAVEEEAEDGDEPR